MSEKLPGRSGGHRLIQIRDAELNAKLAAMQEAMSNELVLNDLHETMEDFSHADVEETPA